MNLLETFHRLCQPLRSVFPQERTFQRPYRLGLGLLTGHAPHLTSTALCTLARQFRDWSAEYRLFSRSPWEPRQIFTPVFDHLPPLLPPSPSALSARDPSAGEGPARVPMKCVGIAVHPLPQGGENV
jgi:hypothetical protein